MRKVSEFCMIFLVCQAVDIYFFTCKTSHLNASHVKTCFKLIYGIKPFQFRWIQIGVLLIGLNQTPSWKGWDNLLLTRMGYSVPTTIFIQQKKTQGGSIQSHVSMMRTADNLAVSLFSNFKTNQEKIRKTGFLLSVFKSPNSLSSALIFSADVLKRLTELCRARPVKQSSEIPRTLLQWKAKTKDLKWVPGYLISLAVVYGGHIWEAPLRGMHNSVIVLTLQCSTSSGNAKREAGQSVNAMKHYELCTKKLLVASPPVGGTDEGFIVSTRLPHLVCRIWRPFTETPSAWPRWFYHCLEARMWK